MGDAKQSIARKESQSAELVGVIRQRRRVWTGNQETGCVNHANRTISQREQNVSSATLQNKRKNTEELVFIF